MEINFVNISFISDPVVQSSPEGGNYYSAFVAVTIIAAIVCIAFFGLLALLLRKQNTAKAHINPPKSNAAYDNPSYKVGNEVSLNYFFR